MKMISRHRLVSETMTATAMLTYVRTVTFGLLLLQQLVGVRHLFVESFSVVPRRPLPAVVDDDVNDPLQPRRKIRDPDGDGSVRGLIGGSHDADIDALRLAIGAGRPYVSVAEHPLLRRQLFGSGRSSGSYGKVQRWQECLAMCFDWCNMWQNFHLRYCADRCSERGTLAGIEPEEAIEYCFNFNGGS